MQKFGPPLFAAAVGVAVATYTFKPYFEAQRTQQRKALEEIDTYDNAQKTRSPSQNQHS
ncbi:hypothetical protein H4R99_001557 [Coemansia sp. RSA 1722]|nr:hypothetical protein H4R99_001557 [Coemansia sp. RSA 1722]